MLPDEEPALWRGVGPFGQGGEGMMGGVPYGRPMAMRGPDLRDGLELDRLPVRLGPFFPPLAGASFGFPGATGPVLDLELQGDVVQEVRLGPNPFGRPARSTVRAWRGDPFAAALAGWTEPLPISRLERARARHHLRWLARVLTLHGLDALGRRALRLSVACAADGPPGAPGSTSDAVRRLARRLRSGLHPPWGLAGALRGVGRIAPDRLDGLDGLGPVARAAGRSDDARSDDPAYRALGFEPIVQPAETAGDGGAWVRLLQRADEAVQALELAARAARAGEPTPGSTGSTGSDGSTGSGARGAAIEGLRGRLVPGGEPPSARLLALVPDLLQGLEWGDAVAALASLDLDLEEAGRGPLPGALSAEGSRRSRSRAARPGEAA